MQPIQSSKSAWPQDPQSRNYQHNNQEFHLNQQRHRLPMPGGLSHHGPSRRPPTPDGQLYRPRPPPVRLPPPGVPPPGVSAPPLAPSMALPLPDFSRPPPNISVPPPTTNQPFGGAFMRGPPPAINRPSHDITHPPPAINHPPHAINRPPHAINHPPPAINRPPSAITRPPSVHYGSSPFDNTRTDVRARKPFPLQNQIMSQSMAFQNRPSLGPRRPPPPPCSMARPPFQLNTERPMGSHGPPTRGPGFPHRGGLRPPFSQRPPFSGNQNKKRPAQQNDKSNPKKAKVDNSAELNFYCEICDREYRLEKTYKEHLSTHVKCGFEGCSYVAAKRLVDQHIQQQHRTGFAKKIWQLQSPKDIEAWRADRKKNYPTTETIARKKAAQEEKMKRGEVLDTKQFGKLRKRGPAGSKDTQEDLDAVEMSTSGEQDNKSEDLLSDVLKKELSDDIIDATFNGTSSENVADALTEMMNVTQNPKPADVDKRTNRKKKFRNRQEKRDVASQRKHTLLEKLLAPDIRHERNVILQCVRHVVKHNFFEKPTKESSQQIAPPADTNNEPPADAKDVENDESTKVPPKPLIEEIGDTPGEKPATLEMISDTKVTVVGTGLT